jgi:hypothetical protein
LPLLGIAVILTVLSAGGAGAGEESVRLETKTGTLYGTLDLPDRSGPFPVALIIAGSGPADRDVFTREV